MEARPGEAFRNILLILLAPIGDTLFATAAIRALRRACPSARLTAIVWRRNRAVLENNPDVDRLIVFKPTPAFFRGLRRQNFDLAVHFAPFHDYFGILARIPRRLALPVPWLFWLLPHRNRRWQRLHARDHYLEVLRPLGITAEDRRLVLKISGQQEAFAERYLLEQGHQPGELLVGIHAGGSGFKGAKRWSPQGFAWVAREVLGARPEATPRRPGGAPFEGAASLAAGAAPLAADGFPAKILRGRRVPETTPSRPDEAPFEGVASVATGVAWSAATWFPAALRRGRRVPEGAIPGPDSGRMPDIPRDPLNVRLVFFGGPADGELARAVVQAGVPDGYIDTCGRVSLSETIGLLSRLDLFVGNDSGPLHLAAALGVPVVGIYGPTNVMNFHPVGPHVRAVFGAVPCPANYGFVGTRPVWSRRECEGECLASIDPNIVLEAAQSVLSKAFSECSSVARENAL